MTLYSYTAKSTYGSITKIDERKHYPVLLVGTAKERTDVTLFAELLSRRTDWLKIKEVDSDLERAGVSRSDAMKMVGHRTESIYRGYAIADERSMKESDGKLDRFFVIDQQQTETSQ